MLDHAERVAAARSAIDYICGRGDEEQAALVPNCPGWTVYNAASHIGRVGIAWEEMITSVPEDPESRARGYERAGLTPAGTSTAELATWAHSAINQLTDDLDRRCYFSMTGKGRRSKCCSDCGADPTPGSTSPTVTQRYGSSGEHCPAKPSNSALGTSGELSVSVGLEAGVES